MQQKQQQKLVKKKTVYKNKRNENRALAQCRMVFYNFVFKYLLS